jgi:ABC-2 type transport system permease protein
MRFTGIVKNKDRFKYAVSMIALFIGLGINFGVQKFANRGLSPDEMVQSLTELNKSLDVTSKLFPSSKYAAMGLVESGQMRGLTSIFLFLVISVAALVLFLYLGELLYFKGVMGVSEAYSKRKGISSAELDKKAVKNPVIKTYLLKELKLLFRTPVIFINCVLMNFLWPLFLLIPFFSQPGSNNQMGKLAEYLSSGNYNGIILAAGFGLVLFIVSTSGVTSTSISRDGQNLYIAKYIPVSYMDQIKAKILSGVVIGMIGMLMMIIAAGALFRIQVPVLVSMFVTGLAAILFSCSTGMLLDLLNPKLNWDNEQKAVKQNLNLIFNMLICVIFAGVNIFVAASLSLTLIQAHIGILTVYGLLDLLLYYILSTYGVKLYQNIEN